MGRNKNSPDTCLKGFKGDKQRHQQHQSKRTMKSVQNGTSAKSVKFHGKGSRLKPQGSLENHVDVSGGDIFPRVTPLVVFLVTSAIRVHYVLQPRNWWMVHPDEVYQSLEIAHIETRGFGFLSHEFSPLDRLSDVTLYRQVELRAGMAAMRSPIFPYFYALSFSLVESILGFSVAPFHLWRVLHSILSSCLPLAVYRHVLKVSQSRDAANVAAILTASSVHLNVFGTHTLIHSFLSPFNFLAMSLLVEMWSREWPSVFQASQTLCSKLSRLLTSQSSNKSPPSPAMHPDINGNWSVAKPPCQPLSDSRKRNHHPTSGTKSSSQSQHSASDSTCLQNNNVHPDTFIKDGSEHFTSSATLTENVGVCWGQLAETFVCGALVGATAYVRPDVTLLYVSTLAVSMTSHGPLALTSPCITLLPGLLVGCWLGLQADRYYYGSGVVSMVNWLRFNVFKDFSSVAFGTMSSFKYVSDLFLTDSLTGLAFLMSVLALGYAGKRLRDEVSERDSEEDRKGDLAETRKLLRLSVKHLVVFLVTLLVYSTRSHKETRFIHDVIVLLFIVMAFSLCAVVECISYSTQTKKRLIVLLCLGIFTASQYRDFPTSQTNSSWVYQKTPGVESTNACLDFIAAQPNASGLFTDADVFMTGGMTLLHHDIPVLTQIGHGYYEFDPRARRNLAPPPITRAGARTTSFFPNFGASKKRKKRSVNEFTQASNYFSSTNQGAVAVYLFLDPRYDYFILGRDRSFVDFGFVEVFASGTKRVLHRLGDFQSEYRLKLTAERVPTSENKTVLLHEADVLVHMGQWEQATKRLIKVIDLDHNTPEAYPPLELAYTKLGETDAARRVRGRCQHLFGQRPCSTPRRLTGV